MSENDTIPKKSTSQINKAVFFTSALLIFLLVAFAAVFPDLADKKFKLLQQQIFTNASWFYILAVALILLSVTFLGLSRYGDIKLGPDHAQPDFSYHSWFAMLFSAGMGIGLMFFGVAEPVMHYLSPPVGTPETVAAAKEAMRLTFFHWGLHAWAIYAADSGILQLPSRFAINAAFRTLSHHRRSHLRSCRPCSRYFCGDRDGLWRCHIAGLRCFAG
jgi:choline/glycine/proline betaine transport protein